MKYEDEFKLSDVHWAISKNIGVLHPYILIREHNTVYDIHLDKIMHYHGSVEDVFNRRFVGGDFEIASTPVMYVAYIGSPECLGDDYATLPFKLEEETYFEFMGRTHMACTQIMVTASQLQIFEEMLKRKCKIGEERSDFLTNNKYRFGYA